MADDIKKDGQETPKLIIELMADGQWSVNGPIKNMPLCLWMLEEAKDVIKAYNRQPPKIQPAKGSMLDFARKKRF